MVRIGVHTSFFFNPIQRIGIVVATKDAVHIHKAREGGAWDWCQDTALFLGHPWVRLNLITPLISALSCQVSTSQFWT